MTIKINCRIPSVCLAAGSEISQQVRAQVQQAISAGLKPAAVPHNTQVQSVSFDEETEKVLTSMAHDLGIAAGRVVGGLLYSLHLRAQTDSMAHQEGGAITPPNVRGLRADQARCMQEIAPLMAAGKIAFVEAGTGAGKARLICHSAAHALSLRDTNQMPAPQKVEDPGPDKPLGSGASKAIYLNVKAASEAQTVQISRAMNKQTGAGPVIICAPAIENVVHLVKEWLSVRDELDPAGRLVYSVVLGRRQFVSARQLSNLLSVMKENGDEPPQAIEQWLTDGMPSGLTEATRTLNQLIPGLSGLMEDLEYLSETTHFNPKHAALEPDDDEEDASIYQWLRKAAYSADLIFTTTAMVCADNMVLTRQDRAPLLPAPLALLVDEAHELEAIQSNCAAKSLSFYTLFSALRHPLWASLRKAEPAKAALKTAQMAIEHLREIPDETRIPVLPATDSAHFRSWSAALPFLSQLHTELLNVLKATPEKTNRDLAPDAQAALRYLIKATKALSYIKSEFRGHITHSPVRGKIGFELGPSSVSRHLAARWAVTPTAVLLSGTLNHITATGHVNTYVRWELSAPDDRSVSTAPLHPAWITKSPTLMLPSTANFHRLIPPSGKSPDPERMRFWLTECSKVTKVATDNAAGGALVLFTSFERLQVFAEIFVQRFPELAPRLIIQSAQERLPACKRKFIALATEGGRPIWLATGAAWTGLNLTDERLAAQDDLLLTDLIMPNLPFGLSRSTTHVSRVQAGGFFVEMIQVQRKFRQGIGRLVRREGLQHRRIWVLDGRLVHPAHASYTKELNVVLRTYIKTEPFKF